MEPFSLEYFLALIAFCFVSSATPGPNNIMLLASGVNFGFRRTIPHMAGIIIGFPGMVLALGLALASVLGSNDAVVGQFMAWLKWVGAAYLVYLAWRTANAGEIKADGTTGKALTAFEAAVFQWVNPKAWAMALAALTTYGAAQAFTASAFAVAGSFFVCAFFSASIWAGFGTSLRRFLEDRSRRRFFNWTMATLLIATIVPIFFM